MYFIGIDPGKNGSVAVIDAAGMIVSLDKIPTVKLEKKDYDINALAKLLENAYASGDLVVLEKAQAMPSQGVTSMFSIGRGYGILLGLLHGLLIPFIEVHPRVWTKVLFRGISGKGKERSYLVARQLFPQWNPKFKYEREWGDSLLLAEYGRRLRVG